MATFNIELNSNEITGTNEYTLMLRITEKRKHIRLKLMYSVAKNQFNPGAKGYKHVRANHPEHARINSYLYDKVIAAKDIVAGLENDGKSITPQIVKAKLLKPKTYDIFVFCENLKSDLLKQGSAGNYKKYRTILNSLKEFSATPELFFDQIDADFLSRYQAFLKVSESKQTTIHGYVGRIRSLFNKAIQQGIIDQSVSPFNNYKIKQGKPSKERLSTNEILAIEDLAVEQNCLLYHVKNCFLFSFYNAGIRVSDILLMTWDNVIGNRLVYQMHKTSKVHSIALKERPLKILEYYKSYNTKYIFPFFSERYDYSDPLFLHDQIVSKTALINKYLKELAVRAKITKKVTTHTARHSFADIARQKTDNIYNLSKTLGHSSIKVTEAYLASFDQAAVDDTMDKMF